MLSVSHIGSGFIVILTTVKQLLKMNECTMLCITKTHCAYDKVYMGSRVTWITHSINPNTKVLLNVNYFSESLYGFTSLCAYMGELRSYAQCQHILLPFTETFIHEYDSFKLLFQHHDNR